MPYAQEKQTAIAAVIQAAQLCETVRHSLVPAALEKNDKSPVTVADYGAQALICKALAETFPNDPVVGEEDTTDLRQPDAAPVLAAVTAQVQQIFPSATDSDVLGYIDHGCGDLAPRYWTLDPIDGTKGFLRGDQYAIALALIEAGEIKVGVLGCPFLSFGGETGLLLVAVRGEGTVIMPLAGGKPQRLTVADTGDSDRCRVVESMESGHGDHDQQHAIARALGITAPSLQMDSQAKYAAVAAGQAVLYLRLPSPKTPDYREKIWDHAAGVIVVEEAGGRVTDMHGKPLDFASAARFPNSNGVVASNGAIHDAVLAVLAAGN